MNARKLLGGVALAALFSGAAHAQIALTVDTALAATDGNLPVRGTAVNGADTTGFVAAEFQPSKAADQLSGKLVINTTFGPDAATPFSKAPVDARVRLEVTLTNATFTSAAAGVNANSNPANAPCDFINAAVADGGVGSSKVTFLSNSAASVSTCKGAGPTFTFANIVRTANGANVGATFTYTQVDASGNAVANPITISKSVTLAQPSASWATVGDKHKLTAGKEILASSKGVITAGAAALGEIQVSFVDVADASTDKSSENKPIGVGATGGANVTTALLFKDTSNLVLTLPQGAAGLTAFTIGALPACGAPVTTTAPAQTVTCTLTAANLQTLTTKTAISATADGKLVTPQQTVTAVLTTATQDNYVAAGFSGNLAEIKHDDGLRTAAIGSPFNWVAFGASSTESQFRISGMTQAQTDSIQQIRIAVAQGGNGVAVPTSPAYYTLTSTGDPATGFAIRGRTITFNSKALGIAAGSSGNADISAITLQFGETGMGGTALPGTAKINRQIANRSPSTIVAVQAN